MTGNGKSSLEQKLLTLYRTKGIEFFLDVSSELLGLKDPSNNDKKRRANGQLCEMVLMVLTIEYLKRTGQKGSVYHSVVIGDHDNPSSGFRTELDFILLTPGFCLTGECKSYAGDINVSGSGQMKRGSSRVDLAKQSVLHGKYLRKHLEARKLMGVPASKAAPMGLFCFVYCNGTLRDIRDPNARSLLPLLTLTTLYQYYDKMYAKYSAPILDYSRLDKFFQASADSAVLHAQHKEFLGY